MRRLVPFLLAAIMASFPPTILMVLLGGLASTAGPSSCTHRGGCVGGDVGAGFAPHVPVAAAHPSSYTHPSYRSAAVSLVSTATYVASSPSADLSVSGVSSGKPGRPLQPMQQEAFQQVPEVSSSAGEPAVAAAAPPDTLKVSVLGASRGKSTDCAYSMVEFSNTHHSDTIVVHSTYIEPTVVFPQNWSSNDVLHTSSDDQPPPPAYHKEVYEGRQLKIPPRSKTTIPVSIIPHYRKPPDLGRDYHDRSLMEDIGRPTSIESSADHLSFLPTVDSTDANETAPHILASHADRLDMLANWRKESNRSVSNIHNRSKLLSEAVVHETLVAYTSWGFVRMRVPYVCSPSHVDAPSEYEYGLPNSLMFLDSGGGWYARRNTTPTVELAYLFGDWDFNPTKDETDPFVYRVYMNNPSEGELRIWGVHATKPYLVGVEMDANFDTTTTSNFTRRHTVEYYPLRARPHPPKKNNIYIATVRLRPDQFTLGMMSSFTHLDLGFLVVRTNLGAFSISLDFIPNNGKGGVIHGVGENFTTSDDIHLVRDHAMNELLSKEGGEMGQDTPNITVVKSFHAKDYEQADKEAILQYVDHLVKTVNWTKSANATSLMKASPASINFGSITTGSRMVRIPVKIFNLSNRPLRIMRISVAMSTLSDDGDRNVADISGERNRMDIGVDLTDGSQMKALDSDCAGGVDSISTKKETFVFPHDSILPPSADHGHTIYVWCRFNASPSRSVDDGEGAIVPRFYTGSLIVQTTDDLYIPYREWEEQSLLEHYLGGEASSSEPFQLQIPFEGSVLPGNLGSPTESLLFPSNFFVLPDEERAKVMSQHSSSSPIPEYYDRELDITNNFAVPISITGMRILDSNLGDNFCTSRFTARLARNVDERSKWPTADTGEKWQGLAVRYHFRSDKDLGGIPTLKCILSIETDKAGKQSLPLIIYSGEAVVDIDRPDGGQLTVHCIVTRHDGSPVISKSGMPCMADWMKQTVEGSVLGDAIGKYFQTNLEKGKKWGRQCSYSSRTWGMDATNLYFQSLLSPRKYPISPEEEMPRQALQPIVLAFGAISTGASMSRSIYMTNMNHAPVRVSATTAMLGNMTVTIGILPSKLHDSFKEMAQLPEKQDSAYFLHHAPVAKKLFTKFKHKFDIVPSPRATNTELLTLFHRHAESHHFSNATEYLGTYVEEAESGMHSECACGYILSTDYTYDQEICSRKAGKKHWVIPPGGVARFVVTVRAPPRSDLLNDVTTFVGTGLVLETNHGQALPIVVTYSAIAGQVSVASGAEGGKTTPSSSVGSKMANHVPLTFKDPTIGPPVDTFAQSYGVPLEIESSFSQSIYLSEIRSCNKWFNVFLPADYPAARQFFASKGTHFLRINATEGAAHEQPRTVVRLGKVLSALSCSHPSGDTSFYACALAWLENRNEIQAPGCGLPELEVAESVVAKNNFNATDDEYAASLESRIAKAKTAAIGALRDVVAFLSVRYTSHNADAQGESVAGSGGYIHFSRMHMFDHVRRTWKEVVNLGLNTLTGHINAKTVYFPEEYKTMEEMVRMANATNGDNMSEAQRMKPPLSIPVASLLLQSTFDVPKLFLDPNDHREFNAAPPSSYTVGDKPGVVDFETVHVADVSTRMVPIVNPTASAVRVRLVAMDSIDGSFGPDQHSIKNVFVQGSPSDRHSWWTGGSYWMSSSDDNNDGGHLISASHNVTIKSGAGAYVSLLNPALHAMNAFILGCGRRCGLRNEGQDPHGNSAFGGEERNFSPIGAASGGDSVLFGRSYECDKGSGLCPASTTVHQGGLNDGRKNPKKVLSITDPPPFSLGRVANEITLPPYGTAELGPVYFRPPGRGLHEGKIYIENSLTGFEEVKVTGRGGWEKLVFLDHQPEDVSGNEEGGDVEFRFGQSTLVFPGSNTQSSGPGPVIRSVRLMNQGDVPVDISRVYMESSEVMHFTHKRQHPSSSFAHSDGTSFRQNSYGKMDGKQCSTRGFVLPGCIDSNSYLWMDALSKWFSSVHDFIVEKLPLLKPPSHRERRAINEASELITERFYKKGFTLQPNQTQNVYITHYPDCTFQTSYASVVFEIGNRSQQPTSRSRVGSWQQTFRQQKMGLLVGYDMSASEYRNCIPYTPPETTIWERKLQFRFPSIVENFLSIGWTGTNGKPHLHYRPAIQVSILAASFILLLVVLSLDLLFTVEISTNRKSCPSWKPTCRCLARADPTSSDLVSIGKEQTKHVLLSRFKKEGVLPSHCILSDGSFSREKKGGVGGNSGTHSEAIFERLNLVSESKTNEEDHDESEEMSLGLLTCGLGWRTALRRGVGLPSSPKNDAASPELKYLTRTRDQYLKKQREQKQKLANAAALTPTKPRAAAAVNGHPDVAEPVTKSAVVAPLPQDRKMGEPQIRKKDQNTANGRNTLSSDKPQTQQLNSSTASKGSGNRATGKTASVAKASIAETGRPKQPQQKVGVAPTDQKKVPVDTKGKQKQRNEPKSTKHERANRAENKKDASKQEGGKSMPSQKQTRPTKLAVETNVPIHTRGDKTPTSSKDVPSVQSKHQSRQAKKAANGAKNTEQQQQTKGGKQGGKQKGASKKQAVATKNIPKSPVSKMKSTTTTQRHQRAQSNDADFPPLSGPSSPPQKNMPKQQQPKTGNVTRPPPGLLAPPGFLDQPDLEGLSTPSSPMASSPTRLSSSSRKSPVIQPLASSGIPGADLLSSPTPHVNNDLLSLIGVENDSGKSSLFQSQLDNSPRAGSDGSALSIPEFRQQSFSPPVLERSSSETHDTDKQQTSNPDVRALLGAGSNFNVTNFLDGILTESTHPPPPIVKDEVAQKQPTEVAEAISFGATGIGNVSLDPWGHNSRNSSSSNPLAALRGSSEISNESSMIAGIPLNSDAPSLLATATPTTLQGSGNGANSAVPVFASLVSEGEDDNGDFLEPDSFYNQLLGE